MMPGQWNPIDTAPDNVRMLLAFPQVDRPRRIGEPKQRGNQANKRSKAAGQDIICRPPGVAIGLFINNQWAPGRRASQPFFDEPTHWMPLPSNPHGDAA